MKIYITEKQKDKLFLIQEGISDKLYHFTSINKVLKILKYNVIPLTTAIGGADAKYINKHNLFYLCCQRSKNCKVGFAYSNAQKAYIKQGIKKIVSSIRIELDGYQLKADGYNGRPLDYWGEVNGKRSEIGYDAFVKQIPKYVGKLPTPQEVLDIQKHNRYFEMEDRIESTKPFIKNASKYIKRIDILDVGGITLEYSDCIHLGKQIGIPVYVYKNIEDFNMQNDKFVKRKYKYVADEYEIDVDDFVEQVKYTISPYVALYVDSFKLLNRTDKEQKAREIINKFNLNKFIDEKAFFDIVHKSTNKIFELENDLNSRTNFVKFLTREYMSNYTPSKEITFDDISNVLKFINYVLKLYKVKNIDELLKKYA